MLLKKTTTLALTTFSSLFAERVGAAAIDLGAHTTPNAPTLVKRKGINCQGSLHCIASNLHGSINDLGRVMTQVPNDHIYTAGQLIACSPFGDVCAFLQMTTEGFAGSDIKRLFGMLGEHGCKACGSVPTGHLQDSLINDVFQGELTVNYVSEAHRHGCYGVCDISVPPSSSNNPASSSS
jgi:hypothetical protein